MTGTTTPTAPHPVEAPLYTAWDAARYLHVHPWGLAALTGQRRHWWNERNYLAHGLLLFPAFPPFEDDAPPPDFDRERISFRRFAEMFVRAAVFQALADWVRDGDRSPVRWENLQHGVWRGLEDTCRETVPFSGAPAAERAATMARPFARHGIVDPAPLEHWLAKRLGRVEVDGEGPTRIYPFTRDPAGESPRSVVLDPRVRFGRPTVRGVPTDSIRERFLAGDGLADLADDFGLEAGDVEEAVRFEAIPPGPAVPFPVW